MVIKNWSKSNYSSTVINLVRTGKGSHEIWATEKGVSVTVNHCCKSRHTANSIMKAANISHRF
jgi:hypothetical protein